MRQIAFVLALCASVLLAGTVSAQVCNLKVVTDANPDYSDIGSMIHSITSNQPTDKEKCWAIWYWNKIGRRQTSPMQLHGLELADPIRQYNDYGFTMCSTVAGVNCAIWGAAGYRVKFVDIIAHTVCEVEYDGALHMYDSSLSAIYTQCDGKTVAAVDEIGAVGSCAASGGKAEPGHIAKYHCLNSTSPNGFLTGADTMRSVAEEYNCFNPNGIKYRWYYNNWDLGHRYILNLRQGESYVRTYRKLGDAPEYFVPNESSGKDPEAPNVRYRIRGNGRRSFAPPLDANALAKAAHSMAGVRSVAPAGVAPAAAGKPGEVVFKIEGANVIASTVIRATFQRRTAADAASVAVSTTNGLAWKEVWTAGPDAVGSDVAAEIPLVQEVSGAYEALVKVTLTGAADPMNAQLKSIRFETVTMVNSKTQPRLRLGKNTVYVGAGAPTESIVFWPDLQDDRYKPYVVEEKNIKSNKTHPGYLGVLCSTTPKEEAYVVFKIDAPQDVTSITYGGRFYNRSWDARSEMRHSFDGGKTWATSYALTDVQPPWDVIHYETVKTVPAGTRSVLFKYVMKSTAVGVDACSLYSVRMEVDHKVADPGFKPMDVTFTWNEAQPDRSFVTRSHRQLVTHVPFTYAVNVGGADQPVMESLAMNFPGAAGDVKYGYSDGKDAGGRKFQDRWVTWGKNLSVGKPYTCTEPSEGSWGAGDPDGKRLTDGVVGPPESGGPSYMSGALWSEGKHPVVTVDLGKTETCGAFCIDVGGYPWWNALKGEVKDDVEVLVSKDDKDYTSVGKFDFNLWWKDIPANHAWPDDETITGHNYVFIPKAPVAARYVRYVLTPRRSMSVSEVQVWDKVSYEPFDLKIALPDGKDRSDIAQYNPKHEPPPAKKK